MVTFLSLVRGRHHLEGLVQLSSTVEAQGIPNPFLLLNGSRQNYGQLITSKALQVTHKLSALP
jgi:hypothetical protein